MRLARHLAKRVLLSLVTLWLLSVLVFIAGRLLPGDVGRAILGPLADPQAVANLDHQLGVDRPALTQYLLWIGRLLAGNLGTSYALQQPVAPLLGSALVNSLKLGGMAFCIVVPLSLIGGIWAALHAGCWIDRAITLTGLSFSIVPEFVSSIVLILVFGVWLRWLPITATWPDGAGAATQIHYLILPALPLTFVFFGYMARMARAGMVEALAADYTRTAILKGLPMATVIRRHVMRNALLPTVTVMATQSGYLIGGLVVVETLFRYQGLGSLILSAAKSKDVPMLEAG
ncbi:MAG TPA: ABC transporter permease, partial [Stellaceae bacterium]|nr:ABC transporter permease [Stellaceae bacterium]